MVGAHRLQRAELQTYVVDQSDDRLRIEDMVMQAAVLDILLGPHFEGREVPYLWITTQVVPSQDLRQMRQIVFCRATLEVLNKMFHRCHRSSMIESAIFMRQNQYEKTRYLEHP
jgi:hypothetical protein